MNFGIAVLLLLQSLPGKAEVEDQEEIAPDLFEYMTHLSDYYYSTEDYYYDNSTATPATYVYEFDSYETNTTGYMDYDEFFPEWNDTIELSGLPDTNAPGDAKDTPGDAKDTPGSAKDTPGSAKDTLGDAKDTPGNAKDTPRGAKDSQDVHQESLGSSLQGHLTLIILLSFLGLLL